MFEQTIEINKERIIVSKIMVLVAGILIFLLSAFVPLASTVGFLILIFGFRYIKNKLTIAYDYRYVSGRFILIKLHENGEGSDSIEFDCTDVINIKEINPEEKIEKSHFYTNKNKKDSKLTRYALTIRSYDKPIIVDLEERLANIFKNKKLIY